MRKVLHKSVGSFVIMHFPDGRRSAGVGQAPKRALFCDNHFRHHFLRKLLAACL